MISLFTPALSKSPSSSIHIDEFITSVKFGTWRTPIENLRNEADPLIRKELKKSLPGVTISGTFNTRSESMVIAHSGFLCIDIDGYTDRDGIISDPYTYALFGSASGGGLAVIVKIDPSKHKESFRWMQNHYFTSFGIPVDPAPSSVASLRFVSYDPLTFTNPKAKKSPFATPKQRKIASLPCFYPEDKVGEMVRECVSLGKNIADSYLEYTTLAFALASGFGESGRAYFHALAGVSTKYNSEHADKQFTIALRNPSGGISVGSFYFMLKQAGVSFPENTRYESAIRTAAIGKKSRLTESMVIANLTELQQLPPTEATRIAHEVFSRPDISLSAIAADPEKLIESLVAWLSANHPIKKNTITGKLEDNGQELTKERTNTIYLRARSQFNTPNITFELIDRALNSEFTPHYNPILDYIEANRHRNTTGNIDRLIASIQTPTPHADLFIRKWLLALPAAIHGESVRIVLALNGVGRTGKTEFFRRLLPSTLKRFYGESKLISGKDDELLMCKKLIVMDDELGGKNKSDANHFKELSSKDYFSLRAPYDNCNRDYKRLALLCGTSNEKELINDPTGNTRLLPVEVLSMDHELFNSIDKDELFMEIVRLYESGESWYLTNSEQMHLTEVSESFEGIKLERELIEKFYISEADAGDSWIQEMTATEIKVHIELHSRQQIKNMRTFGIELKKYFGISTQRREGSLIRWVYKVVQREQQTLPTYSSPQRTPILEPYEKQEEIDL